MLLRVKRTKHGGHDFRKGAFLLPNTVHVF
jgi:hypothetical protein